MVFSKCWFDNFLLFSKIVIFDEDCSKISVTFCNIFVNNCVQVAHCCAIAKQPNVETAIFVGDLSSPNGQFSMKINSDEITIHDDYSSRTRPKFGII